MLEHEKVREMAEAFAMDGDVSAVAPIEVGLINATFEVRSGGERFVVQRLNGAVFADPRAVMRNVALVTEHLAKKAGDRPALRLVPAQDGRLWVDGPGETLWRCYRFLEGCRTVNAVESPEQAREAGRAFGRFLAEVGDLPADALVETIPGFHDTAARYQRLMKVAEKDPLGRRREVEPELEEIRKRRALAERFGELAARGELPRRVVHNDTKINNVMFDAATGKAVCVIDLDTVMPGLALHDFGDLVRSAANAAAEDERDPAQAKPRLDVFEALAAGFLETAGDLLNERERAELVVAPQVLALELAIRFLTDHLEGDVYFAVRRPGHNLDRCRIQLGLLRGLEETAGEMERRLGR